MTNAARNDETRAVETSSGSEATRELPTFVPNVDIFETVEELVLLADMPGVRADDLEVTFEKGQLILRGRVATRERSARQLLRREYSLGDFYRVFNVSETIDASRISAEFKNGVLHLHLPKVEAVKPRRIEIRS